MDYFKHDINASEDDKICDLLANGGYEMLGYYWRFVEYLYSRGGRVYKTKIKSIAWSLHMDSDKLGELISNYDLFCEDEECIYSKRVVSETEQFEAVGKRMAEIGKAGGKASAQAKAQAKAQADAQAYGKRTVKHTVSDSSSVRLAEGQADAQQNKIKENKIKENKINKKENIKEKKSALSGVLSNGVKYYEVDGRKYNEDGKEINDEGFEIIDFGLSKKTVDF